MTTTTMTTITATITITTTMTVTDIPTRRNTVEISGAFMFRG